MEPEMPTQMCPRCLGHSDGGTCEKCLREIADEENRRLAEDLKASMFGMVRQQVDYHHAIAHATPAQLAKAVSIDTRFREEELGGVLGADGNVYSDADPGL